MEIRNYLEVKRRLQDVKENKSEITGDSQGDHYYLGLALSAAGVSIRGLTSKAIEDVAMDYLIKEGRDGL